MNIMKSWLIFLIFTILLLPSQGHSLSCAYSYTPEISDFELVFKGKVIEVDESLFSDKKVAIIEVTSVLRGNPDKKISAIYQGGHWGFTPIVGKERWFSLNPGKEGKYYMPEMCDHRFQPQYLDNYIGIDEDDRNSYSHQLRKIFLDKVEAKEENINLVSTSADFNGTEYERKIQDAGGIDMQLLGIGGEGHIGFNEIGSKINSRTRKVDLSPRTKEDNGKYFSRKGEKMPDFANTMGIGTILEAKEILVLANGPNKAIAIKDMMDAKGNEPEYSASREHLQQLSYEGNIDVDIRNDEKKNRTTKRIFSKTRKTSN